MATSYTFLEDRGVLTVGGADARGFLQGLLTLDMEKVSPEKAQAGALLSPQGKILFDILILEHGDRFWIETTASHADALIKRLNFYKLRARVEIDAKPGWHMAALWDFNSPPATGFADPRWEALGRRAFVEKNMAVSFGAQASKHSAADYHAHRIFHGIPEAEKDYALGDTFPQEANFDLLNGTDFEKGCYVGQEVVSRMHHRGMARKRILLFEIEGTALKDTPISAGDLVLGQLCSSSDKRALGLIRLDRLEQALTAHAPVVAGKAQLKPLQPEWANFAIAGAA